LKNTRSAALKQIRTMSVRQQTWQRVHAVIEVLYVGLFLGRSKKLFVSIYWEKEFHRGRERSGATAFLVDR